MIYACITFSFVVAILNIRSHLKGRIMAYYDYSIEWHRLHGRFRVLYNDGQLSQPFNFWAARAYASIFGGKVVRKNYARILHKQ